MGFRGRAALVGASAAIALLVPAAPGFAVTSGAVTTDDRLLTFDTASPGTVTGGPRAITGLQPGESVLGIDLSPANGLLYAFGSSGRIYTINPGTAEATQVGTGEPEVYPGSDFGFDFNPVADRLRIVSDAETNRRVNPNTGALVAVDSPLDYAAGDSNDTADPNVVGAAYTNNFAGATTTTVFTVDSGLDVLARLGGTNVPPGVPSPNGGQLFTVGPLGVDTDGRVGLDFQGSSTTALATLTPAGSGDSSLYTINSTSGAATLVGQIGPGGFAVKAFTIGVPPAIQPAPEPAPPAPPDTTDPESLLALASTQKLKKVLRRDGFAAELSCDEACDATATLRSRGRKPKTLGTGAASLDEAGVGRIEIALGAAGEKYLKKRGKTNAHRTRLNLALSVADGSGNQSDLTKPLTLTH